MSVMPTRLDGFLRVVELDEDAAMTAHGSALRELTAQKSRCDALRLELRSDRRARGPSQEWMVAELERQRLVEALRLAEEKAVALEKVEQAKKVELMQAHQKAESIRHAIARMRSEKIRALDRQETRALDEIAIMRHQRKTG